MAFIDKIAWIQLRDRKLLCARSKGKAMLYLPGGKREEGETDAQTLVREVQEELAVTIDAGHAEFFGIFEALADGRTDGLVVRMTCYTAPFQGELTPTSEIAEIAWLDSTQQDKLSAASKLIFDELKKRDLID